MNYTNAAPTNDEQEEAPDYGMNPNMSYCMFENTLRALQQAAPALFDARHLRDLSSYERDARENLLEMVKEIGYQIEDAADAEQQREEALANAEATVRREYRTNADAFREADERAGADVYWVNTHQEAAFERHLAEAHLEADVADEERAATADPCTDPRCALAADHDGPCEIEEEDEDAEPDDDSGDEDADASEQNPETGLASAQLDLFGGAA